MLAVSIHSSLFVPVGIRFCSVSLSNFYVFVACLGLTVKFALKRVRSSRRVSWTLGTMYCVQTIRPINQVVWQLSNSCSPVGRMWGDQERKREFVGVGGVFWVWEDICMQIEEPCILSLLSRSRAWVGGMLGTCMGWGLVILRRASLRVALWALCIQQSGNLHRLISVLVAASQQSKAAQFEPKYLVWNILGFFVLVRREVTHRLLLRLASHTACVLSSLRLIKRVASCWVGRNYL
jgi:hypothetical protein